MPTKEQDGDGGAAGTRALVLAAERAGLALDDADLRAEQHARIAAAAAQTIAGGTPRNTLLAYLRDFASFKRWCAEQQPPLSPLPTSETAIMGYLTWLSEQRKPDGSYRVRAGTIERQLSGIVWAHAFDNHPNPRTPRIKKLIRSIKVGRSISGEPPPKMAAPLTIADLRRVHQVLTEEETLVAIRNRAIIMVGWACAMRRSEICALDFEDLRVSGEGVAVTIRRAKTDQLGQGVTLPIARESGKLCPVRALERWLEVRGSAPGPLFCRHWRGKRGGRLHPDKRLNEQQIGLLMAWLVKRAELRSEYGKLEFSAHSLRAGYITEAVRLGRKESEVQKHSRHKTHRVFMGYVRITETFKNNPVRGLLSDE